MDRITTEEAETELSVIILKDDTLKAALNAYTQKDHARLGAIISQHIEDEAISSRARFVEALKKSFASGAGISDERNPSIHHPLMRSVVNSIGGVRE